MTGFAPIAGREELEGAMRNRFYDNVSRPGHYGFVPAHGVVTRDMVPLGRPRGVRGLGGGLGDLCDDPGATMGMALLGTAMRIGGSLAETASRATVTDGAKTGGDRGVATLGTGLTAGGAAIGDAWAAACLSSTRAGASGAAPSESIDSVLARARAEAAAAMAGDRATTAELALASEREDRQERLAEERAASQRNLYIALGVGAVVVIGGIAVFSRR